MKSQDKPPEKAADKVVSSPLVCMICGHIATRLVDGDPSCEEHTELVYEDQVEAYTQHHLTDDEWLEKKT